MTRDLRRRKDFTLSDVSNQAGLSVGHPSQVEHGLSTPTICQLQQIASIMGVTIGWFVRANEPPWEDAEDGIVVRAERRRRVAMWEGIVDGLLVPHLDGAIEILLRTLQPGAGSGPETYAHEGAEAGLVVSGEMELFVSEERRGLPTATTTSARRLGASSGPSPRRPPDARPARPSNGVGMPTLRPSADARSMGHRRRSAPRLRLDRPRHGHSAATRDAAGASPSRAWRTMCWKARTPCS